jgi:hypothetical protein
MDPQYYTRIAMAGWMFVAVIIASMWASDSHAWKALIQVALSKDVNTVVPLTILGAVVGIGAPPAVGFLMEKLSSTMLWVLRWNMERYPCAEELILAAQNPVRKDLTAAGVFHVLFYSYAPKELREWAHRRRTQMYAAINAAFAMVLGLVTALTVLNSRSYWVFAVSLATVFFLGVYAHREARIHKEAVEAWVALYKGKVWKRYSEDQGDSLKS